MLIFIFKILSLILCLICVLVNIIGLPGNILIILIALIWYLFGYLSTFQIAIIASFVLLGEIIEFISGFLLGKISGINNISLLFSIFCSFIFALLMAPIFFGLGSLIGAFVGAFTGVFIYEVFTNNNFYAAIKRSYIVLKSRILGTIVKFSLGILTIILISYYLF